MLLCTLSIEEVKGKTYSYAQLDWSSISGSLIKDEEKVDSVSGHFVLSTDIFMARSSFSRTPVVLDLYSGANLDFYGFGDGENNQLQQLLLDGGGQYFSATQRHSVLLQYSGDGLQMGMAYQVLRPQQSSTIRLDNTFDHSTTKVFLRNRTSQYFSFKLSYQILSFGEQWYHEGWIDQESYSSLPVSPNAFQEMLNPESWSRSELIGQIQIISPLNGLNAHIGLVKKNFDEQTVMAEDEEGSETREDLFAFIRLVYSSSHELTQFQSSRLRLGYTLGTNWENNSSNQSHSSNSQVVENAYSFTRLRGDLALNLTLSKWRLDLSGVIAQKNFEDRLKYISTSANSEDILSTTSRAWQATLSYQLLSGVKASAYWLDKKLSSNSDSAELFINKLSLNEMGVAIQITLF